MERPRIDLPLTTVDYLLELVAGLSLLVLLALPAWYYADLPDIIPRHFNGRGEADGYGRKQVLLVIPLVGLLIYAGLTWLNRFPHLFNFPVAITPSNAEYQYRHATRLLRMLKAGIISFFAFMVFRVVEIAMGRAEGLGKAFVPIVLVFTFGVTFYFLFRSLSKQH